MDYLDYTKNYGWEDQWIKTKEIQADVLKKAWVEIKWITAIANEVWTASLDTTKWLRVTIDWTDYILWLVTVV